MCRNSISESRRRKAAERAIWWKTFSGQWGRNYGKMSCGSSWGPEEVHWPSSVSSWNDKPRGLGAVPHWAAPAGHLHKVWCERQHLDCGRTSVFHTTCAQVFTRACLGVVGFNCGLSKYGQWQQVASCLDLLRAAVWGPRQVCTSVWTMPSQNVVLCTFFFSHSEVLTRKCVLEGVSSLSSLV